MKKVIGIVSEGPTDYLVLKAVIDKITGEENRYGAECHDACESHCADHRCNRGTGGGVHLSLEYE